ncbi:type VII secretion integral membrane protein EccD [Mycolicibacterium sp. 120270]|uniref:type VII secretion integral membrane protein EccD n=1 Tax=Mycolicibacterium sp. 120270 TaxID=3090600 RepID=UPI00299DFDFB|nr:type VII secretion integral membrane protein EccD [Mycolicibacterium sp. 120270]MDX1885693.1 type VII secretion integral membrane protein EccD [Mycolicibacterium sp. 120270]
MSNNTVIPIVRVAVLAGSESDAGGRLTEMALPAELPLREIIPAVARFALPADEDGDAPVRRSLAPIGGAPFSLDATLDTVGVVDGDLLALQPLPAGPSSPPIVEDIADAAVIFSAARKRPWGIGQIRRAAAIAVIGLVLVCTGLAVAHHAATGQLAGLLTVSAVAAAAVLATLLTRARLPEFSVALSIAALVPVAAAFALAVPGEFGSANVVLGAAGVTAFALISRIVSERAVAFFTATVVTGLGVLLAAGVATLWHIPVSSIGCGLIVVALLVTVQAAQLSALWARFPLPVIPAPGDPTPSAQPRSVLEDLPRRVRLSDSYQTGFIAAGVLLSILGSLLVVGLPSARPSVWAWILVVAAAAGATLRARVWDTAACKAWLLSHTYLLTVALVVTFAVTGRYSSAWWALGVLAVLVAVWVVVALNPGVARPDSYSLPLRRLVGFAAAGIDASIIPVAAYLIGLFDLVLNR